MLPSLSRPRAVVPAIALAALGAMGSVAPRGAARAQDNGGLAIHHLSVAGADFGDDATIRERQSGLRGWSSEYRYDSVAFRFAAAYAYTRYEFDGLDSRDRDLHHLHVPLHWRTHDARWLAVLTPVIATSSNIFKDLVNRGTRDDYDLYARLEHRAVAPNGALGWRAALVRDAAFGRPLAYPELAILWSDGRVEADVGLPRARVDWKARDDLALGISVAPAGAQWHVVSDERGGAEFDFRARAWRGAFNAAWRPWRFLRVNAQLGIEFARNYEFEDDSGTPIKRDAASAPYWRIDLAWDF